VRFKVTYMSFIILYFYILINTFPFFGCKKELDCIYIDYLCGYLIWLVFLKITILVASIHNLSFYTFFAGKIVGWS